MKRFRRFAIPALIVAVLIIVVTPYLVPLRSVPPPERPYPNSRFADVGDARLHYRVWEPEGSPKGNILLVHGFCCSTFTWRNTVDDLAHAGFRVVAADAPPFGYSDRFPKPNLSNTAIAHMMWSVLTTATPEAAKSDQTKWILVGHSMGASIVSAMAVQQQQRTASVVLVDGGTSLDHKASVFGRAGYAALIHLPFLRRGLDDVASYYFFREGKIRDLLMSAFGKQPDDATVAGHLDPLLVQGTAPAIIHRFRDMQDDPPVEIERLTSPLLVIWGERDSWIPLSVGRELCRRLPQAKLVVIPDCAHAPMETHTKLFNDLLIQFALHPEQVPIPATPH